MGLKNGVNRAKNRKFHGIHFFNSKLKNRKRRKKVKAVKTLNTFNQENSQTDERFFKNFFKESRIE